MVILYLLYTVILAIKEVDMYYYMKCYNCLQDRNRVRNEFIGLKLNDVIKMEREKCEQRNSGMDMADLQVKTIYIFQKYTFHIIWHGFWSCRNKISQNNIFVGST